MNKNFFPPGFFAVFVGLLAGCKLIWDVYNAILSGQISGFRRGLMMSLESSPILFLTFFIAKCVLALICFFGVYLTISSSKHS